MNNRQIVLKKVCVHNLKGINLRLDTNQFIVFTGVSGSGKSSLAFDTIYVEGQRRYLTSLSHQMRRFLHEMPKPKADLIDNLSPTIAIEQKNLNRSIRSTVSTVTGIYDYLRVLFAKVATAHCPISKEIVKAQSKEKIFEQLKKIAVHTKIIILAPLIHNKKGSFEEEFAWLLQKGFLRVRIDGKIEELESSLSLNAKMHHNIDVVIDRIALTKDNFDRVIEAATSALEIGKGYFSIINTDTEEEMLYSQHAYCAKSQRYYPPLIPSNFSFNHPSGMCQHCQGLGKTHEFNLEKIIDDTLSLAEDCCIIAPSFQTVRYGNIYQNLARLYHFSIHTPWKKLPAKAKHVFLYGTEKKWTPMIFVHPQKKNKWTEYVHWKGVVALAHERLSHAKSDAYHKRANELMTEMICPQCQGSRLAPYPSHATLGGKTIHEITQMDIHEVSIFFQTLQLNKTEQLIAQDLIKEIQRRLHFLCNVGLDYLTLDRTSPSLSGGEAQRIKLAAQIGCGLINTIYILDEPSIGLHPHDHHKLINTLQDLKNQGNTVIVIEHDRDTIGAADTIVDIGPEAGYHGGEIIEKGTINDIIKNPKSLTGSYLSYKLQLPSSRKRKPLVENIYLYGACHNNLKNIDIQIPLNLLTCICGVSGSGKSSLIADTLYPICLHHFYKSNIAIGKYKKIEGLQNINKVIFIDQSPIGKTPRSNPSTYTKVFDDIRSLFSSLPTSKMYGFFSWSF